MYLKNPKRPPITVKMLMHRYQYQTALTAITILFIYLTSPFVHRVFGYRNQDTSWDVLIFTQNWPISVCNHWVKEGHECRTFPNDTWTIHGIWPTKFGKIGPGFCNMSRPFNPEAIYGLEDDLEKYWTPVEKHKKKTALWAHEWEKHGTCAAVVPSLSTEFQYFYQGLTWIKSYNIHSVLDKAGISPGKQYNVTEIWDGIQHVLGKNPQVVCYDEKGNKTVLLEIRICFDPFLNLVDCDGTVVGSTGHSSYHNLTNCAMEKFVQYPNTSDYIFINNEENIRDEAESSDETLYADGSISTALLSSDDISDILSSESVVKSAEELCDDGNGALAASWSGVAETFVNCVEHEDE